MNVAVQQCSKVLGAILAPLVFQGQDKHFRSQLSLLASFAPGDGIPLKITSPPFSKKKDAFNEVCLLVLLDLLRSNPNAVRLMPAIFSKGDESICEIRAAAQADKNQSTSSAKSVGEAGDDRTTAHPRTR